MTLFRTAGLALLCAAGSCLAQAPVQPVAPAASAAQAPAPAGLPLLAPPPLAGAAVLPPAPSASAAQARPIKQVIEDDAVRIEETRVRGQTQRITVQSKVRGVQGYEIIVPAGGKDPSQDRGAAGQRIWHLFDF